MIALPFFYGFHIISAVVVQKFYLRGDPFNSDFFLLSSPSLNVSHAVVLVCSFSLLCVRVLLHVS